MPGHKLDRVDLQSLVRGEPIVDLQNKTLIDPGANPVSIYAVAPTGPQLKYQSHSALPGKPMTLVVLADNNAPYSEVVAAIDVLRQQNPDATVWIAPAKTER